MNDQHILAFWAADCAEHVLHIFEAECPGDPRPRQAIEAARAWQRGHMAMVEARKFAFASHAAARAATSDAATEAARAAGHAAATAHVVTHAPHAARYARKAAAAAGSDVEREWRWQTDRLPIDLRGLNTRS